MVAYTSSGTGNWNVDATWGGGGFPQAGDTATIRAVDIVTIVQNEALGTDPANYTTYGLDIYGTLKWATNATCTLTCTTNIRIRVGGTLEIGSELAPINVDYKATLYMAGTYGRRILLDTDSDGGKGTLRMHGAVSYHMADATKQRARLLSDVALGPATITLDADTDYLTDAELGGGNGDTIWLGSGGSRTTVVMTDGGADIAGFGNEQVRLLTKVSANTYTTTLTYNHNAGDLVVHGERNAIILGVLNNGFEIYQTITPRQNSIQFTLSAVGYVPAVPGDVGRRVGAGAGNGCMSSYFNGVPPSWTVSLDTGDDWPTVGDWLQIQGGSGYGRLSALTPTQAQFQSSAGGVDVRWAKFKYGGAEDAGFASRNVFYFINTFMGSTKIVNGMYIFKNVLFDTPGYSSGSTTSYGVLFYAHSRINVTAEDIDEVHAYGYLGTVSLSSGGSGVCSGLFTVGHLTGIHTKAVLALAALAKVNIKRIWHSFTGGAASASDGSLMSWGSAFTLSDIVSARAPLYGIYTQNPSNNEMAAATCEILGGEILNGTYGISSSNKVQSMYVKNVYFRHMYYDGAFLGGQCSRITFDNCEFHNCIRQSASVLGGGIRINSFSTAGTPSNVTLRRCKFGTDEQNHRRNISLGVATLRYNTGRILIEGCIFKKPFWNVAEPSYSTWGEWRSAIVFPEYADITPLTDEMWLRGATLEIVDPTVYDAAGVERWATAYPGITRMARVGSGGEVWNENSVLIDDTIGVKITPFSNKVPCPGTYAVPLQIPVTAGQNLQIQVQFRKTRAITSATERPSLHAFGCGIDTSQVMPDVTNVWTTLSISETATYSGMVRVWFEAGVNYWKIVGPSRQPEDPWWMTVYVDGMVVTYT